MEEMPVAKYRFGIYELDCGRRTLTCEGEALGVSSKAFDLLQYLVENHGKLVSKGELLENIWPDQFVEENNLAVQVSALRKALGFKNGAEQLIVTVPGKGYSFVAEVDEILDELVVEKHSLSRVVIDEEITDRTSVSRQKDIRVLDQGTGGSVEHIYGSRVSRITTVAVGILILFAAIGAGVVAYRGGFSSSAASAGAFVYHRTRQLTASGNVGNAALSPDGKTFVYTTDELGQKALWLGYVNGGNHIQLRPPSEVSFATLVFSPDSSQVYYSIRDADHKEGQLFRVPASGGAEEKLLQNIESFSLSPDGSLIAVGRRGGNDNRDHVELVPLGRSPSRQPMSFPIGTFVFDSISWSPDGRHIALAVSSEGTIESHSVTVIDVSTGQFTKIDHPGLREITKTAWVKDGDGLLITAIESVSYSSVPQYRIYRMSYPEGDLALVTSDRSNYGRSWHNDAGTTLSPALNANAFITVEHRQLANVWIAPAADPAAARQITFGSFGKYDGLWGLDWTVDGRLIYTTSDTESQFLATMDPSGSGQKPLTSAGQIDSVLTVTNDSKYIIFHSDRGGDFDIWRSNIDGSEPKQLTFGGKSYQASPSPDGRWVYFKSWMDNVGCLYRVPIDGGEPEKLTDKETSWVSFSPDGKYFAGTYRTDKLRLAIFSAETNKIMEQFPIAKSGTLFMGSRWTPDSQSVVYRDNYYGYWQQSISGREPTRMQGLPKERLYNFAYSKDGQQLAFVRGNEIRDVVLIESQ